MRIYWKAFWAWVAFGLLFAILLADELLGIAHVWGLDPITTDAERDPKIAGLMTAWFVVGFVWWRVHLHNNKPGARQL